MNFYQKYNKYKAKYIALKSQIGAGYDIVQNCQQKEDKSDTNYYQQEDICKNLVYEMDAWIKVISFLIKNGLNVFVKGGSPLGLKVLQLLDKLDMTIFDEFMALSLIKDWDFAVYYSDKDLFTKIEEEFKRNGFEREGHTIVIYRYKSNSKPPRIMVGEDALFEISLKEGSGLYDNLSESELPLTTMTIKLTENNISYFFRLCDIFYRRYLNKRITDLELSEVNIIVKKMEIYVPPAVKGLFQVDKIDYGKLTAEMKSYIDGFTNDVEVDQFLASHIVEPDRLFIRFLGKNLPKSNKIKDFLGKNGVDASKLDWLLMRDDINMDFIRKFIKYIGSNILKVYNKNIDQFKIFVTNNNKYRAFKSDKPSERRQNNIAMEKNDDQTAMLAKEVFGKIDAELKGVNIGRLSSQINMKKDGKYLVSDNILDIVGYLVPEIDAFILGIFDRKKYKTLFETMNYVKLIQAYVVRKKKM